MAGNYTYTQPTGGVFTDPISEVRFLLNDSDPKAPFSLSDEEVEYLLQLAAGNAARAASNGARRMATAYTKSAAKSKSVGNLSLSYDYAGTASAYTALADELLSALGGEAPSGPIWTESAPMFCEGQFDNGGGWFRW